MTIEKSIDLFGIEEYLYKLTGFFIGAIILGTVCFIDDIKGVHPLIKLAGQVVAAGVVVLFGIRIVELDITIFQNIGWINDILLSDTFSIILTIGWIVGITNAINLMDGMDGLSSGISVISCLSLLMIFALNDSPLIAIIMITALAGALVGFLPFNFKPAKTFIGDTGSNFLGYTLSIVSILGIAKTYTAIVIVLPVIVLGLPIFDTIWAIFRRLITGKSLKAVFKADKGHLHHRLIKKGFTQKQAVLVLYGISATFGMFAVILLESGIWKALSFFLIVVGVLAFGYKEFTKNRTSENGMYECMNCKYIYNPKAGNELAGISPSTQFNDIPDSWRCPVCGVGKEMFKPHDE